MAHVAAHGLLARAPPMRFLFALTALVFVVGCAAGDVEQQEAEEEEDVAVTREAIKIGPSLPSPWDVPATQIATYEDHACALQPNGKVACWGNNAYGQLGRGYSGPHQTYAGAISVVPAAAAIGLDSSSATFIIRPTDGVIQGWGRNSRGILGSTTPDMFALPQAISGFASVTAVAAGTSTACALSAGNVSCWGYGILGALGDGDHTDGIVLAPGRRVRNVSNAVEIGAERSSFCARMADGSINCWGWGFITSTTIDFDGPLAPRPVLLPSRALTLSVGDRMGCAVAEDRKVYCWGGNAQGEVRLVGGAMGVDGALSVATSGDHTCAIVSDHTLRCWGRNHVGQLGNGITAGWLPPVPVSNLSGVTRVSVSASSTCAIASGGFAYCWGANNYGQVGMGTTSTARLTPAKVQFPQLVLP
jgi:alpha-tubulin suppressor-like RCC1 family protein